VQDGARGPASFETQQKLKSQRQNYGAPSSAFLYGVHAVTEALLNPKRLHQRLLCTSRGFESMKAVLQQAVENGIKVPEVITVEKEDIERLLPREAVHQDILLDCQPLEEIFLGDILISAPENATILVLDQVTDPHNVGAILRSAASFGAVAVVAQRLHSPDITGMIAKAASGGVEHVPFVREVNLSRALEQLKDAGFFCIGLDEDGKKTLSELKMTGTKVAIVLGAEGDGLRRLVAENCDELVRLPTQGRIASLNVSNAAAVALYEMARK
jgi:23S rRNA (guanosine2251-2'-O)-methyltransferase